MAKSQSYQDLEVYKLAHQLGVELHHFSLRLPKFELYETGAQLRRASKSISANIVEGFVRRTYRAEFVRYLIFASSSCDETKEWLQYIHDCHMNLSDEALALIQRASQLGVKLHNFIQAVKTAHQSDK